MKSLFLAFLLIAALVSASDYNLRRRRDDSQPEHECDPVEHNCKPGQFCKIDTSFSTIGDMVYECVDNGYKRILDPISASNFNLRGRRLNAKRSFDPIFTTYYNGGRVY